MSNKHIYTNPLVNCRRGLYRNSPFRLTGLARVFEAKSAIFVQTSTMKAPIVGASGYQQPEGASKCGHNIPPLNVYVKMFRYSRMSNSKAKSPIWSKMELIRDILNVLLSHL